MQLGLLLFEAWHFPVAKLVKNFEYARFSPVELEACVYQGMVLVGFIGVGTNDC